MKWLVVALIVVGGIWGALELRERLESGPRPLFPALKSESVGRITVRPGVVSAGTVSVGTASPGAAKRASAVLEKEASDWVVASEDSFPAEAGLADKILAAAKGFSRKDVISSNPEKHSQYQVDSAGVVVTIEDTRHKVLASFIVGRMGPDYQTTYVRDARSKDVILAQGRLLPMVSRGARSWQDKRIFAFGPDDLAEIGISKPGATIVLKRGADQKWSVSEPETSVADPGKITRLARTVANLRCDAFAGRSPVPQAGLENPDSSVWVKTTDGRDYRLLLGHADSSGRIYAKKADSRPIYLVAAQNVKAILPDLADLRPAERTAAEEQP